jgi:hypothetical protein
MKQNVVVIHFEKGQMGKVMQAGSEIEVIVIDDRGSRREVRKWVGEPIEREQVVSMCGTGFYTGDDESIEGALKLV